MQNTAFVFPGQGSQQVGMLAELAEKFSIVKKTFATASDILGFDVWQLSQRGPEEKLNITANTQPAILTASFAVWQVWQSLQGNMPCLLAGHSLGEYTALVCAGVLSFEEAVKVVHQRGLFMQQAVAPGAGAMAAIIGSDDQLITECCGKAQDKGIVSPANYNSIGQTVIAGDKQAVELAAELAKQAGARKVVLLAVSVPSHCALMQPAAEHLTRLLDKLDFNTASTPLINNVTATIETDAKAIKTALIKQLTEPVQWVETIKAMQQYEISTVIECGPGKVLTGMNRRISKAMDYFTINSSNSIMTVLDKQKESL